MFNDPLVSHLVDFVREIGIDAEPATLEEDTFLPGLDIQNGVLVIDEGKLIYPGDILHEAGHIAVADAQSRAMPKLKPTKAEEMAAAAWSFAAVVYLGLDPETVFHSGGYDGGAQNLIAAFSQGNGPGVPILVWLGLTIDPAQAEPEGPAPFPHMIGWLRDAANR